VRTLVGQEWKEGRRLERPPGRRPAQGERLTEAVLALAVCHNVTPVYEDAEGEGSLPESDQVKGPVTLSVVMFLFFFVLKN
jgi:hypothetical protein